MESKFSGRFFIGALICIFVSSVASFPEAELVYPLPSSSQSSPASQATGGYDYTPPKPQTASSKYLPAPRTGGYDYTPAAKLKTSNQYLPASRTSGGYDYTPAKLRTSSQYLPAPRNAGGYDYTPAKPKPSNQYLPRITGGYDYTPNQYFPVARTSGYAYAYAPQYRTFPSKIFKLGKILEAVNAAVANLSPAIVAQPVTYSHPQESFPYPNPVEKEKQIIYNSNYPLTTPTQTSTSKYRIGAVSDLDRDSVETTGSAAGGDFDITGNWVSFLKEGSVFVEQNLQDPESPNITITWDDDRVHTIRSGLSYSGRGMELSTLNVFNGHLYSCDDKTGVVYELPLSDSLQIDPIPWTILADGNFTGPHGFKCEWATVKDNKLWVGGHGRNTIDRNTGSTINENEKYIKKISATGEVRHFDWSRNFDKMAEALDIHFPGYVSHESAGWSDLLQKWIFMPRKISKEMHRQSESYTKGSNTVLCADEKFQKIEVNHIGDLIPTHGFSSFKFIPGTGDRIVLAIKSVETPDGTESYVMVFNLNGKILVPETKFADMKYEGVEFI